MRREEKKVTRKSELPKIEFESDELIEKVKSHTLTKIILVVGGTIGVMYLASFVLKAAAKTAESWRELKQKIES